MASMPMDGVLPQVAHTSGTRLASRDRWLRTIAEALSPTSSGVPAGPGATTCGRRFSIHLAYVPTQGDSLTSGVPTSTSSAMRKTLSGVRPEPVTLDDVKLPAHLEEWLGQIVGSIKTSFTFDPDTYFDTEKDLYGED